MGSLACDWVCMHVCVYRCACMYVCTGVHACVCTGVHAESKEGCQASCITFYLISLRHGHFSMNLDKKPPSHMGTPLVSVPHQTTPSSLHG